MTDNTVRAVDVLSGKGPLSFHHAGNVRYREAILKAIEPFVRAEGAIQRNVVVLAVINSIISAGGRFLHKVHGSKLWVEMSSKQRMKKVSHAIRDAVKHKQNHQTMVSKLGSQRSEFVMPCLSVGEIIATSFRQTPDVTLSCESTAVDVNVTLKNIHRLLDNDRLQFQKGQDIISSSSINVCKIPICVINDIPSTDQVPSGNPEKSDSQIRKSINEEHGEIISCSQRRAINQFQRSSQPDSQTLSNRERINGCLHDSNGSLMGESKFPLEIYCSPFTMDVHSQELHQDLRNLKKTDENDDSFIDEINFLLGPLGPEDIATESEEIRVMNAIF